MADDLALVIPKPIPHRSPTEWLVLEAVRQLNGIGPPKESTYAHTVDLLRGRKDATAVALDLMRAAPVEDVGLRWSALYVVGDVGQEDSAEPLVRVVMESLPKPLDEHGCEGPQDGEVLIRTMAIEAIQRIADRYPNAAEHLLRIIAGRPDRRLLIEAVKAATALKLRDKVVEHLPPEDHWMLDLKLVPATELAADPERSYDKEPTSTPPRFNPERVPPRAGKWEGNE